MILVVYNQRELLLVVILPKVGYSMTQMMSISNNLSFEMQRLELHWLGKPGPSIPPFRRWIFQRLQCLLCSGLTPAIILCGPRRVGKTVLMRQLMVNLITEGIPPRASYTFLLMKLPA